MTISFTVSSPGKIILSGEHSVVYDKPALAGVIGLRTNVTFNETDNDTVKAVFDLFPDISPSYQLATINELLKKIQTKFNVVDLLNDLENGHDAFLALVQEFVLKNTQLDGISDEQKSVMHKIMTGIVYLLAALETNYAALNGIEPALNKGIQIEFKSQIPIGAGLGSSAAFGVCVAAIFYTYTLTHSQPNFVKTFIETASDEERILFNNSVSSWAFLSERIMHGTPSGLDNTVCTFGNVVEFTKNPKRFMNVALKSPINIMLVNTGVSRNTSEIVRRVQELKSIHTKLIDTIMDAMAALVDDVVQILENVEDRPEEENYLKLKRLFSINNNLLRALGVSHPVLEEIFAISERLGFSVKLTGAGAGGFAIILLPSSYANSEAFHNLCKELSHFETNVTTIGGLGMQLFQ
ncbi:mevalonate kinase [Contarinia nasturtii]|uniref:mevalonate kinase n=1 Tax=Contarinia nasturtii TaxID=265458 RepID=UPI0012D3F514|nr:mevalonate kinase [Contarinia nasturtii]